MCSDGMFWCAFELVTGVGLGAVVVLWIYAMLRD